MKKILVIGLNPTKLPIPRQGGSVSRFSQWMDRLNINIVSFTNLSPDPYWDGKEIDEPFLRQSIEGYDKIIVWGNSVSKYVKKMGIEHFVLPHPSPLNRQINDHDFIEQKLKECEEYLSG